MPSQSSLLTVLLTATTLISGGLLCAGLPAAAQRNGHPYGSSLRRQSATEYTVLHVNPLSGDDQLGDGTRYQPFKTITQALHAAQSGTVILLAPGQYTTATGESFPLRLRPGISLQGQPTTTQSVLIQGGGSFTSNPLSTQNAAVVMADRSGLAYVVVSNPTPQGHGVWIESGQPVIRSSALVASEHTGLYIAGGTPTIENSYFTQNGVAGLVLYGQARAIVRGNYFENTGTAITVADGAYAEITDNRILRNDEGLVLLGNARPLIANNQIAQNRRNGVVEVALSTGADAETETRASTSPLLASRDSGRSAVDSSTRANAEGALREQSNAVAPAPISTDAPSSNAPIIVTPELTPEPDAAGSEASAANPLVPSVGSLPVPATQLRSAADTASAASPESAVPRPESAASPETTAVQLEPEPTPAAPSIAELRNRVRRRDVTLAGTANDDPGTTTASVPVSPVASAIGSGSVDIAVIPAEPSSRRRISPPAAQPSREITVAQGPTPAQSIPRSSNPGNRLSVPGANIPVGSGGSNQFSPPANVAGGPPAPPSRASALGLTYRVFVDPRTAADRDRIRQLVPDAFRTQLDGRPMMQVGAYADEATAQARQQLLLDHGIDARVEYLP
ncbi:MAG: DUF1565 domain-containing protein [Cyanobacteria bacterium J06632_22]